MGQITMDHLAASGPQPQHLEVLSGWKDIGNYLGKGVRTVQRYERELGLPVRRPSAKQRGSVLATKGELDAWVLGGTVRGHTESPRPRSARTDEQHRKLLSAMERMKTLCNETKRLREECCLSRATLFRSIRLVIPHVHEDPFQRLESQMAAKPASSLESRADAVCNAARMLKVG